VVFPSAGSVFFKEIEGVYPLSLIYKKESNYVEKSGEETVEDRKAIIALLCRTSALLANFNELDLVVLPLVTVDVHNGRNNKNIILSRYFCRTTKLKGCISFQCGSIGLVSGAHANSALGCLIFFNYHKGV